MMKMSVRPHIENSSLESTEERIKVRLGHVMKRGRVILLLVG